MDENCGTIHGRLDSVLLILLIDSQSSPYGLPNDNLSRLRHNSVNSVKIFQSPDPGFIPDPAISHAEARSPQRKTVFGFIAQVGRTAGYFA